MGTLLGQETQQPKQESGESTEDKTGALTDGLLDLLKEPDSEEKETPNRNQKSNPLIGQDDADSQAPAKGPLDAIHQSMVIAADFLNRGSSGTETQALQSDIVDRMDDIIQQMEKMQQESRNTNSTKNSEPKGSNAPERQPTANQEPLPKERQVGSTQTAPNESSSAGTPEQSSLQQAFRNNRDLQEQVWGQLPERIRKQMRSKMVEQFLPSYREQIQDYFESLLRENK